MAKILLIETDRLIAQNMKNYLEEFGHEVDWQVDPQAAVYSADKSKPDVVILDVMLAGHSGVEFLYEFRSYPDWQQLPVVVYSNVSERELGPSAAALTQLNVSSYHYKPQTSLNQLAQTISVAIKPV